jgi:hypothetical protein
VARRLRVPTQARPRSRSRTGAIDAEQVIGCGLYDPAGKTADVRRWLAEERVAAATDAANGRISR